VTLADYFRVLRTRARVWIVCVVLGLGLAGLYNYLAPVKYTATATAFVLVTASDPTSPDNFQNSQFAVQRVKSYAPLINSPDVILPVLEDLELDLTPRELREMISVSSPAETVLMEFSVTDTDAQRAAVIANATAAELGQLIEEIETPDGSTSANVKVTLTQPAEVPSEPSAPRSALNLLLGLVAGLAVGFVAALARHALDRRIKTPDDVRAVTGIAPLGSTLRNKASRRAPLVVLDHRSAGAERYRTVRSALKFAMVDSSLRHVVISSPHAGDGKTTVACNLALSWAQSGARVCLVEADLRRPGVAALLDIDGSVGLSEVLVGDVALDDVLVPWNDGLLTVLPSGSLPPDPAALLGSDSMGSLVTTLRDRFDLVIYDTPPMNMVADAAVLGRAVDGVVLVVNAGVTSRDRLASCIDILESSRVTLLGTVLGSVSLRGHQVDHYSSHDLPAIRSHAPDPTAPGPGAAEGGGSRTAASSGPGASAGGEVDEAGTGSSGTGGKAAAGGRTGAAGSAGKTGSRARTGSGSKVVTNGRVVRGAPVTGLSGTSTRTWGSARAWRRYSSGGAGELRGVTE
jgi:polysaccharide biosynthesis transport protein